ncbi:MAG TPA: hypothetical protein VNB64_14060 [Solirubrobacteraceae bacterium]|nr:hypothetical protein [Solirubrobacteraceae bacterium]
MRIKGALLVCAVGALAVPSAAGAANTRDSVTGGGQAIFDARDATAGDTVAFQAHRAKGAPQGSSAATGQIQVNRRGGATADDAGHGPIKFHGTITCMNSTGDPSTGSGYAYMSGVSRATKTQPSMPFELYVRDGGKGPNERNDSIMLFVGDETANNDSPEENQGREEVCGFTDFNASGSPMLARGNVQVRNRNTSEDNDPAPGTAPASGLALPPLG